MINQWIFTLLGLLLLFDVTGVVSQGNSNRNFRPQKRKPTPTKKTGEKKSKIIGSTPVALYYSNVLLVAIVLHHKITL